MELGRIDPERLVFVDEMGTHTSLAPLYAYAPVGERVFFEIPRNRGKNTTLLASLHQGGAHRGDGSSIDSRECPGRKRILRSLWLPNPGAATMKGAVGMETSMNKISIVVATMALMLVVASGVALALTKKTCTVGVTCIGTNNDDLLVGTDSGD
jgi:hypothetical protein